MPKYLSTALVTLFTMVAANVSAEQPTLKPFTSKVLADCGTPAIAEESNLIVLNGEEADLGRGYASSHTELPGYIGPGVHGLQTFYPTDPSDRFFGPNPISQMSVFDVRGNYDKCFLAPPSTERDEDIEAANRAGIAGLNLNSSPELTWKGGLESRWLRNQIILLQSETGEWRGVQLPRTEMWSLKAISLPMPHDFGRVGPFKALDVAAWNNEQVQALPR
jgi:hypothetical protein